MEKRYIAIVEEGESVEEVKALIEQGSSATILESGGRADAIIFEAEEADATALRELLGIVSVEELQTEAEPEVGSNETFA